MTDPSKKTPATNPPAHLPAQVATEIREAVRRETRGLTCSVGVAPNQLLAKARGGRGRACLGSAAEPVPCPGGVRAGFARCTRQ